nr:VWA domain-containing protein [Pseudobutyrivibrio sp.]
MKRNQLLNRVISLGLVGILYLSLSASAYADVEGTNTENTSEAVSSESAAPSDLGQNTGEPEGGGGNSINDGDVVGVDGNSITTSDSNQGGTDLDLPKDVNNIDNENQDVDGENPEDNEAPENEENPENPEDGETSETGEDIENPEDTDSEEADDENAEDDELSEEDLQWDLDGDGILSEEELAAKELAEAEALAEEEEEECEHDYLYISNKDGTHTVSCHNCDMEPFIESCEYDENGVCKKCGYKRLPDPVLIYEDEEIIITVSGAVPENADLTVKPIKKENEETAAVYTEVENQLANESDIAEADNFGFLAYDIAFIDIESGEEVEPSGDVKVSMETKTALKPADLQEGENVEKVDVDVRHFNEQTATIDNLSDQGAATLNLDDNDAVTSAEFTSDSFSTFVITWKSSGSNNTYKVNIEASYWDTEGNELTVVERADREIEVTNNTTIALNSLTNIIEDISGYEFVRFEYVNSNNEKISVDSFSCAKSGNTRYLYLKNGNTSVQNVQFQLNNNVTTLNISLIYDKADLKVTNFISSENGQNNTEKAIFILKKDNAVVAGAEYVIDGEQFTTDSNGKFTLKSSQSAVFFELGSGTYTVTETDVSDENDNSTIDNYIVKVANYESSSSSNDENYIEDNKITVTVAAGTTQIVKVKNLYTKIIENAETKNSALSKFIGYDPDNDDYKLTIKFSGPESRDDKVVYDGEVDNLNVDVVLVIDKSNSMNTSSRINKVANAVDTMADIFKTKESVDSRFKVVYFNSTASIATPSWITAEQLKGSINTSLSAGTNYEAALNKAQEAVDTSRSDAKKVIIFLTDGEPSCYVTNNGGTSAITTVNETIYRESITAAANIECDAFYAIGVDFGTHSYALGTYGQKTAQDILQGVVDATEIEDSSVSTVSKDDLNTLFNTLSGKITTTSTTEVYKRYLTSGITLTDPLSEYVEIKPDSEFYIDYSINGNSQWSDDMVYQNGHIGTNGIETQGATLNVVANGATYVLKANYNADTKTMKLILPPDFQVDSTYSFSVVFRVIPSALAYEEFRTSGYPHEGDEGTNNLYSAPTSAGKAGFYSNKFDENGNTLAVTNYNYKGQNLTEYFPRPVIQVNLDWNLFKVDGTSDANKLGGASFRLEEIEVADGATPLTYQGKSSNDEANKGEVIWYGLNESTGAYDVETTIAAGHKYKMTEITAPTNYLV